MIRIAFFLMIVTYSVLGQTGSIEGLLKDSITGEEIIGANVIIEGTTTGASTDIDGAFFIKGLQPGTYNLLVSFVSYKSKTITAVKVESGQSTKLGLIRLDPNVNFLEGITIVTVRKSNTEQAVVQEIKESEQVVSGISAEQISKSQDGDAAKVAARIPGVTLVENRFVMIRGLSQRYNAVLINGANAPSTETDSRAFSFDLIPSGMLDRMLFYKSGSAEIPGDFAGAVIKVFTKRTFDEDYFKINISTGFLPSTTFRLHTQNLSGKTDFLGFDNGDRSLPVAFPPNLTATHLTPADVEEAGKSLPNNYAVKQLNALPDIKLGLDLGKKINLFDKEIYSISSLNYSHTYQLLNIRRNRYEQQNPVSGVSPLMFDFEDAQFSREVRLSAISNWMLVLNAKNSISFRNLLTQLGESETTIRTGVAPTEREFDEWRNYGFRYMSRTIYSAQLEGKHELNNERTSFTWIVGYSHINRNEPDYRRFRTIRPIGSEQPYMLIDPPGATTFDAARFYSNLKENVRMHSLSVEHKLGKKEGAENKAIVRGGYYAEMKSRTFDARWMSYVYPGFSSPVVKQELLILPIDQIFAPENIKAVNGFVLREGTNPSDRYEAGNTLLSGYLGISVPFKKFNLSTGGRVEYNRQTLLSATQVEEISIDNPVLSPLPFMNLSYNISKKNLVRLAYSRTINRPEFRELAPFLYYDFNYDVNIVGNPELKFASIDNVDLRYEFYPSAGETVTFGFFYKRFLNPIENYVVNVGLSQQLSLDNADKADNYGIELEMRKSLHDMIGGGLFKNISLVCNAAYIYSQVDLGSGALSQEQIRPLQGQSPYVINIAALYSNDENGLTVSAMYNVFGKRIFFVGFNVFPTVYEMPRHVIDLTVSKSIGKRTNLKIGVSDMLGWQTRFVQDSNRDGNIDATDDSIMNFRRGPLFSAGWSLKF